MTWGNLMCCICAIHPLQRSQILSFSFRALQQSSIERWLKLNVGCSLKSKSKLTHISWVHSLKLLWISQVLKQSGDMHGHRKKRHTEQKWLIYYNEKHFHDIIFLIQSLPVDGYRGHWVDAGEHRSDREEVVKPAVHLPKVPLSVCRVDEVDERVEGSHGSIRESQVQQEIVGDGSHPLVRQNNPNDDQVSENGHCQHRAVRHWPQRDAPRRLHELVGQISGCVGSIPFRGHSSSVLGRICFRQRIWHAS